MRIGVDVDEVLGEFLRSMLPWLEREYGLSYGWHDMHTYAFYKAWGVPYDEAREYIDEFLESRAFKELDCVPGSREAVSSLAEDHSLVVVTSRPEYVAEVTRRWVAKRYGDVFDKVLFTNAHGVGSSTSKAALVDKHGVAVHVDDNPAYCENIVDDGGRAVLMNKPWNVGVDTGLRTTRVDAWSEVVVVVESLSTRG